VIAVDDQITTTFWTKPWNQIMDTSTKLKADNNRMYHGSGTVHRIASGQPPDYAAGVRAAGAGRRLHVHSPDSSTFRHGRHLESMTLYQKSDSRNPSIDVYLLVENCAKFHPNLIWNDGALGFYDEVIPPTTRRRTRRFRVAIWDHFLIQKFRSVRMWLER